jgi:sugar/nucleoside kinase (ribokinase family)
MVPAFHADKVVDPTGAGVAFAAGLAIALADGLSADVCGRYANAVASFAVEGVGMDGLADRAGVDARMAQSSSEGRGGSGSSGRMRNA